MTTAPVSPDQYEALIAAALDARNGSYSPYSHFRVGAALLLPSGEIIKGANIENASFGGTICAERTALVKAVSEGKRKFAAIAVASDVDQPVTSPCGICRQFIREFCGPATPIVIISNTYAAGDYTLTGASADKDGSTKTMTLDQLLPMSFGPGELEMGQRE